MNAITQQQVQDCDRSGDTPNMTTGSSHTLPPVVVASGDEDNGRKKAPKCEAPALRKDAKTTEELTRFAFARAVVIPEELQSSPTPIPASSSSSAASITSEHYPHHTFLQHASTSSSSGGAGAGDNNNTGAVVPIVEKKQQDLNRKMLMRTSSRQGRETQRWSTEADTNQRVRLVTGCVPILKGGRILFVSASRKLEWILPKGGWERDESMEESAVRETFEEAGVLGTLGPQLTPVQYETRKSKKRRKDMAELLKKTKDFQAEESDSSAKDALHNNSNNSNSIASPPTNGSLEPKGGAPSPKIAPGTILSDAVVNRIRESKPTKRSDETSSNASDSSTYSLVRMTLFPLYVSEIKDTWPESGRFRKTVHIDEAIEMLASREEFRSALIEVKERKLHLVSETPATIVQKDPQD
eukprot:CAMPEP_0119007890 /NCGR_PEP_ID=MMETSP1176-20130426/3319_1 /TAXON_ID=265551 /ORGANISM="Synedropsis recta cf, Strain CCMP1620" /LENGTH=411 /DNA_ID=CAMNT_0006960123 /DNA_START=580 /DNA_END=1815 /DNA_ORIENTATION=+